MILEWLWPEAIKLPTCAAGTVPSGFILWWMLLEQDTGLEVQRSSSSDVNGHLQSRLSLKHPPQQRLHQGQCFL